MDGVEEAFGVGCCCDKDEVFGMAWPDGMERLISRRKCEENK